MHLSLLVQTVVRRSALLIALGAMACLSLTAEVRLASPFTDHLVLQRELPVPVWGEAAPGERVRVAFAGQTRETVADEAGRWRVELAAMATSDETSDEGRILEVSGTATAEPLRLADVLVGEVWLASGQSNMDFTVARTEKYTFAGVANEAEEVASATYPRIRMFKGEWQKAAEPCERVGGRWLVCTPENVREFSAVG
ncbi:MAG: sialate O-acetylesterase, partial [Opitutaceae bacterium]|nr:sialate O-acetylesterase [Opitutaceae bacterium]